MAHSAILVVIVQQKFGVAADGGQRCTQFMAYVLYEVAPQAYKFLVPGVALLQFADKLFTLFLFVRVAFQFPMDGEIG